MTASPSTAPRVNLARSTLIVMGGFAVAKVISLLQTVVIAQTFGVGEAWDTYVTANRVPETLFTLVAGGALGTAFLPVFSGLLAEGDRPKAWRTASHVINTVFTFTLLASVVSFLAAPWLVGQVVAPGFSPELQAQTVGLMRVLLVSTVIFSVSGILMGVLQSHNHFLMPALAPIMFDVGILFGVLVLLQPFGLYGVAYGAVIGAALHLLVQVPGLFLFKARWTPAFGLKDPELWRILRLMVPRTIELGMFSISFLVMTNIASRLGTGSVSALDWGWRLMQIPQTLIGTAMGVVIFPTLAALSQLGDVDGKRGAFSGALRFILIGSIPSAIGLILVGRPLISLLEGGAFDAAASDLVYSTLAMFSLGIVVHSILEVVARGFYADKDMLTPLWVAVGGAVINVGLAVVLSGVLSDTPDSEGFPAGLALANSLAVTFEVVVLMGVLRRRWRGLDENSLGVTALKTTAASLVMGVAVFAVGWVWALLGLTERGTLLTLAMIGAQVAVGAVVFVGAAYALKLNELRDLLTALSRRFSRQPREVNA